MNTHLKYDFIEVSFYEYKIRMTVINNTNMYLVSDLLKQYNKINNTDKRINKWLKRVDTQELLQFCRDKTCDPNGSHEINEDNFIDIPEVIIRIDKFYNNNTNIQYYNDNNMNQRSVPMASNSYAPRSPQKVMNQTNNYQQEMQYASMKRPMDVPETKQMKMTPEMSHQYKTMQMAQSTANPMNNQYGQMNTVPMMTPTPRSSVGPVTRDKQVSMTKNYGTAVPTPAPLYPTPQQQQPIRRLPMNTQSMKNENLNRAQKGQSGKASIPQPMTEKKQMYA